MRGPLSLRVNDGDTDRHVTARTRDLRFKRSAFGGDVDLTCRVSLPRSTFTDLGPGDALTVYDTRSGDVVWSGNVDSPGEVSGPAGQVFDLQAFGGAARLQASKTALGYVVRSHSVWKRSANTKKGAQTRESETEDGDPSLVIYANEGKTVGISWRGEWVTKAFERAGLQVAAARASFICGLTDSNYRVSMLTGSSRAALNERVETQAWIISGLELDAFRGYNGNGQTQIAPGDDVVGIRVDRDVSSITATDEHWFEFTGATIRQLMVDVHGVDITTGYNGGGAVGGKRYTFADAVIRDMLGRGMAPGADPRKASVASFDFEIDHLDWLDGITMGDALHELLPFEPDLYWTLYGDRFTAAKWDTANPRYVVGERDGGISLPGQELTLCNRVLVTWTDESGREESMTLSRTIPGLDYTRDAEPVALPEGMGSVDNATQAGLNALDAANNPPRAGTAVVRRKIRDQWAGVDVWPHEIMPGCVVVEQATGDTFRLTEVEYADADGAATLTLGEPVRTQEQMFARMQRDARRQRKR